LQSCYQTRHQHAPAPTTPCLQRFLLHASPRQPPLLLWQQYWQQLLPLPAVLPGYAAVSLQ
jgi:hypothetical protein